MQEIVNEGWVKLHRKILKSDMWKALTAMQRDLLVTVMLKANHKPKRWEWEGQVYTCKEGEFITSIDSLKKTCAKGTSTQNIRTGLKKLEKWEFLTDKSTKTGRKIFIINWDTYQKEEEETNKDTNGQLTDSQQTANRQLTPNKNVKNDKEVKHIYGEYKKVRLTDRELEKLKEKFPDYLNKIKQMDEGEEMKKYGYKSHYLAILKWARNDEDRKNERDGTDKYKDLLKG